MGLRGHGVSQSIFKIFSAIFFAIFSVKGICATATQPAVKVLIALVMCISIDYTVTRADSFIRLAGTTIIGLIAVVNGTYKTPPLCQLAHANEVFLHHHARYGLYGVYQGPDAPCHIDTNPRQAILPPTQAT